MLLLTVSNYWPPSVRQANILYRTYRVQPSDFNMPTLFSITSLFKLRVWLTKCDWIMTWDDTFEILLTAMGRSGSKWRCSENRICIWLEILKLWHYFHPASEWTGEKYTVFIRCQGLKRFFRRRRRIWVTNFDLRPWLISKNLARSGIF